VSQKRKPPRRAGAAGCRDDDPVTTFFKTAGELLESAVACFKAGERDSAFEFVGKAIDLCEQNPVYAVARSSDLSSSLQQIIHCLISNAIAKGHSGDKAKALLGRIQALHARTIH
jgi:hypothetical protein